jgi:TrmH family RNA methyltransferase
MGAIFEVCLARVSDVGELPGERVALLAGAEHELRGADAAEDQGPLSLLVGAERDGLPVQVVAACERSARIAIAGESLNAAMAATVALYEVTRGRERASRSSRVRSS